MQDEQRVVEEGRQDVSSAAAPAVNRNRVGAAWARVELRGEDDALFQDYLARALSRQDNSLLDATILRVGSLSGRQLLAWQASAGRLSYEQLVLAIERARRSGVPEIARMALRDLDGVWGMRLARVMALQNFLPEDRLNALDLFELSLRLAGPGSVTRRDARTFCDVAIDQGRSDLAKRWLEVLKLNKSDAAMVQADLANPFVAPGRPLPPWLQLFNRPFLSAGLEPVFVEGGDQRTPYDRLSCRCNGTFHGPLVTIIVSCWQPDLQLLTSVKSLLAQTWRSIEIIVVDDASPEKFQAILDELEMLDERITVIRQPRNQGTYVARNAALQVARGEFVTFQDSDDWSHPRRIERQVAYLLEHPDVIGISGQLMRVTETLMLGLPASPTIQEALPLFMFRREPVVGRIGFYDSVRKSADREYIERLSVVFGQKVEVFSKEPLGIYRLLQDSLSRSEFKPGWRHAARNIYRDAFNYWHARIARAECSPYRSAAVDERTFPAPRRFWIDQEQARSDNAYDFVFIGDWRQYGGPQKSMIEEIRALKVHGHRIGICHQEAFRFMTKNRYPNCDPIRALIADGTVDEVAISDRLSVGVLVLRYPPILQFVRHEPAAWTVGRALVVANQAPYEMDGTDVRYRVEDCIANFRALFGLDAVWVPQGPLIRDAIENLVPPDLLDPEDMPGIVDVKEWRTPSRRPHGNRLVVGRYSRENIMKFPGTAEALLRCYPAAADIDVRIMGGEKCCPLILGDRQVPDNWTLLPYGDMPVDVFLANLDFFVYYDNDEIVEAFGRSILEALASGVIVVLPRKFERVFGSAPVYAEPDEVEEVIRSLHSDPERRRALSEHSLAYVREHFGYESYAARMGALLRA